MKKRIELDILNLTRHRTKHGYYNLWLVEKGGNRFFPITIGGPEIVPISSEMDGQAPFRPMTHDLFSSVLGVLGVKMMNALIHKIEGELFYTYIYMRSGDTMIRIDSRPADAIALALRMKAPILIYDDVLTRIADETLIEKDEDSEEVEQLKSALQKAIAEENYELAAKLRDKMGKQKPLP